MNNHTPDDLGEDGKFFDGGLPFYIDHDLQLVKNGTLYIHSTIEIGELDRVVILKPFYEIVNDIIDNVEEDYQELYGLANELTKESERLRELAQKIEDSDHTVADLFDARYDSTA